MANVSKGQTILATHINDKVDNDALVEFGKAVDLKFSKVIFVGTEEQWNALGSTEQKKYILRAVPL